MVKRSLRQVLVDSHVAAVIIAVLLILVVDAGLEALWRPLYSLGRYVFTALAILDIPYFSFTTAERVNLIVSAEYLYSALFCLGAAWVLSRWLYGNGPLRVLAECGRKWSGR